MAKTVLELSQLLDRKAQELQEIYEKHKSEKVDERGQPIFDMPATILGECRDRNTELNTIGKELEHAQLLESFLDNTKRLQSLGEIQRPAGRPDPINPSTDAYNRRNTYEGKSLGSIVINSNEYKFRNSGNKHFNLEIPDINVKTLISEASGYSPPNYRTTTVVPYPNRRPVIADLIPTDATTLQIVKWMEQTGFTNNAATVSEGGLKPESAMQWTERQAVVQKIATWVPVTEEQVDDVPGFEGLVNNNLILMLQLTEEIQLLTGNGTSPNLLGFLSHPNIQTQARGTDDNQDGIYKAFTLVRWTGFAEPSGVVMHPNNWQSIRLLRTTDGLYIYGNPSDDGQERLWGKPVIVTTAISQGTSLTGDFMMYAHISRRMGIRVDVSDSHDTYFVYNKLAVRAEMRESLEIRRGSAFAQITGLL